MRLLFVFFFALISLNAFSQRGSAKPAAAPASSSRMSDTTFAGIKLRNIGPAFMSGRISDAAIHPVDENIWYVASASGGVWKTINGGTTMTPIFDDQPSYSIGCVTIDPGNPHIVWVGTGENVGGRHVAYGDGIYRSEDDGAHWKNMGLKNTEHISRIVVHPSNSNIIWVAAQGPLWTKGGERGIYKSTDGGKTWKRTLGDAEWTGATDLVIDPRNPDWLYAATWQRHRTVAKYIGGGPGSGLHRSTDGGETWTKLTNGLPSGHLGKIGLAISPQKPDVLYADIELELKTGGLWKSTDRGMTWEKQSSVVSGGTGAHYYQELVASPHHFDRIYLMNYTVFYSDDGGKTFKDLNTQHRHGDNHSLTFKKNDPNFLLIGTDGGLYESMDDAATWRYIENLPVTQFYKIALDDRLPFYYVYGGTQDNSTEGGPTRTDNVHGIQNSDWRVVLDWDGHQPATEPGNPNIMYAERQEGNLSRVDHVTGEVVDIQPQPEANENYERYNWDAPIFVSPHQPSRIYFGSQRLWRSDNRGDQWKAISPDLTRNQDRFTLPIMGNVQSWNEAWDVGAMSNYNTITSVSESPKQEGLIYIGTDDGLIQVTEDGGTNWRKIEVGSIPGVPAAAFVNDIKADLHDANTVYVCLDNHKSADYAPYVMKSTDRGRTWQSIRSNLPDRTLVWRLVQDHVKKELMFVGTEFGIYFTTNGGGKWIKLTGGVPTISFRDLAIQKRENDLVGASFGRGIYVLDDYSVLREVTDAQLQQEGALFSSRKALWYIQRSHLSFDDEKGTQGAQHFVAPNPPYGAVFTYHLRDGLKTKAQSRKEMEKGLSAQKKDIPWPGWDALEAEAKQDAPKIWLVVKDGAGNVVQKVSGPVDKGFHRVAWNLRYPAPEAISLSGAQYGFGQVQGGLLAAPGEYTVTLVKQVDGAVTELAKPVAFTVEQLYKGTLPGASPQDAAGFWRRYEQVVRQASAIELTLDQTVKKVEAMEKAAAQSKGNLGEIEARIKQVKNDLFDLSRQVYGDAVKGKAGEKSRPTIGSRLFAINKGINHSTYGPTATHRRTLEIVEGELTQLKNTLQERTARVSAISRDLVNAGAPWIEGEPLPDK